MQTAIADVWNDADIWMLCWWLTSGNPLVVGQQRAKVPNAANCCLPKVMTYPLFITQKTAVSWPEFQMDDVAMPTGGRALY